MGIVRMGPPTEIILELAALYQLNTFVETGTFEGNTALWAAQHFDKVITVENSRTIYEDTITKIGTIPNVDFRFGNSRNELNIIIKNLHSPAIFWLDGHWCGGDSYGQNDQCPLLEELEIINQSHLEHFIFIDDARLFLSPPPHPNSIESWPIITEVAQMLITENYERYTVVIEDVIIVVPMHAKPKLSSYCQDINNKAWLQYGERLKQVQRPYLQQGLDQVFCGLKQILCGFRQEMQHIRSTFKFP